MTGEAGLRVPDFGAIPPGTSRRICIAIPTFRRLELLERLLGGIAGLRVPAGCALDVLVMDNDSARSAAELVANARVSFPFPLSYAHVAEPGLSSVRNFALAQARRGYDFLAMIDDDERPHPLWLVELLRVQGELDADAVFGPVPKIAPQDAPRWLCEGGFLELPEFADGALISDGWSGNCLLRAASLERFGIDFDPAFNFAGGEDLLFFRQMLAQGARLGYARNAVADEYMERERYSVPYILKLNFRRGNTLSLCDRRLGGMRALALRPLKAYIRFALGCAGLLPRTLLGGRIGALRAACDIARGLGSFAGLSGFTYRAYDRPDRA